MFSFTCAIVTSVVGAVLVVVMSIVGYVAVPSLIETITENELVLLEDTIQMERFEEVPFPLNFTARIWAINNPDEVLAGGVPVVSEVGPYIYKVYQRRVVEKIDGDFIHYRIVFNFEFDAEASYPNTEDDTVTIINVVYHAILQVAEDLFPALMPALAASLNGIFGAYNAPIINVRVRDLLFDGIRLCDRPGLISSVACSIVKDLSADAQNLEEQADGSILFSLLKYRNAFPSGHYVVHRGTEDSAKLGLVELYEHLPHFLFWMDGAEGRGSGVCNMINGTDSGIFAPFLTSDRVLYAINTDICRSVELRYQMDTEYEGIPVMRYAANEWFLSNDDGCFCLNVTRGINRPDGCLLSGAMELYTCVGAYLILTYPHYLFADDVYRNGVVGVNPTEANHKIFLDLEPNTGTVIRGMKRAQFNVFARPVTGISATQNFRTTLTPIVWIEEGMSLPEEYVQEITTKLLMPLRLVNILIPVLIAFSALVLIIGLLVMIRVKTMAPVAVAPTSTPKTNTE